MVRVIIIVINNQSNNYCKCIIISLYSFITKDSEINKRMINNQSNNYCKCSFKDIL